MNGANSGRVWKRQPPATFTSSMARLDQSSRSSSSSLRTVSEFTWLPNSPFSSATDSGSCEASSAASMMRFASGGLSMGDSRVDRGVAAGLRDFDQRLPRQLQQREEADYEDCDPARGIEQFPELQYTVLLELAQDGAHVLAHRELLARDLVVLAQPRAVEQRAPGFGKVARVHVGQALARRLLDVHDG